MIIGKKQQFIFKYTHNGKKGRIALEHPFYTPLLKQKIIENGIFLAELEHPGETIKYESLKLYYGK